MKLKSILSLTNDQPNRDSLREAVVALFRIAKWDDKMEAMFDDPGQCAAEALVRIEAHLLKNK